MLLYYKTMLKKIFLIVGIFSLFLFIGNFCLGAPPGEVTRISPIDDASDVPVNDYFKWQETAEATSYILTIDEFTQEEDNIPAASICSGGTCSFSFLSLSVDNINHLTSYHWKVRARNPDGEGPSQINWWLFTTKQAEAPPLPPCPYTCLTESDCGSGGGTCVDGSYEPCPSETPCCCQVGGPGPGPIDLINPLKATTLWEAINALINFLVLLAFAVAPILIIYAAFLILTAAGKAEQINKAKTIIFLTLIALAIILLAKGLPSIIKGAVGG